MLSPVLSSYPADHTIDDSCSSTDPLYRTSCTLPLNPFCRIVGMAHHWSLSQAGHSAESPVVPRCMSHP